MESSNLFSVLGSATSTHLAASAIDILPCTPKPANISSPPRIISAATEVSAQIDEAAGLYRAGASNRIAIGHALVELQKLQARKGNGIFLSSLKAIGIPKATAYDYMQEASGLSKRKGNETGHKVTSSTPNADNVIEFRVECDERQKRNLGKLQKENPRNFERLIHEAVRVATLHGFDIAMKALANSVQALS